MARESVRERKDRLERGGEWLRSQRLSRDWTQAEFATQLGLAQSKVSAYESGRYEVDVAVARDIARALGLTEWTVWGGLELPRPAGPPDEDAIQTALEEFPDLLAKVPEIYERITGRKLLEPPPHTSGPGNRHTNDTRSGEKDRDTDHGEESAV